MAARILVVEDDPQVARALERVLARESYEVRLLGSGRGVSQAVRDFAPDLILLDVKLPDADGRDVLRELRDGGTSVPAIFLSALGSEADKVIGLDLGADDYIAKPFGAFELAARVRACLRRAAPPAAEPVLERGPLFIDAANRLARLGKRPLKLQPREFDLLVLLASRPGRLLTRAFLIESLAAGGPAPSERALDTPIKNLRRKLGPHARCIETVPKQGYRFNPPEEQKSKV